MLASITQAIAARPRGTRLVYLSDFDGTIAEFTPDPTLPRPSAETSSLLSALARRDHLSMGIVSGRRVADLRTRTQLPSRVYLAGLHGMEIEVGTRRWSHPDLNAARDYIRALEEHFEELRDDVPGMLLEDKEVSIAVHVRGVAPERRAEALTRANECATYWTEQGFLRRLAGNMVLEFLPNIACHKGDATQWIADDVRERCQQPPWVVFVGDDITDEDAFAAISDGIGVLVGERESAATYKLDNIDAVNELLAWLVREA